MRKISKSIILAILLTVCLPMSAFAFEYGDNPKWGTPNFSWNYKSLPTTYRDNFAIAINSWESPTPRLNFSYIEDKYAIIARLQASGKDNGNDGYNGFAYHYHASNHDKIILNTYYASDKVGTDENWITGVLGHEIGHTLGLDHVKNTKAIMCTEGDGRSVYKPSQDDIDGANFLY